MLVGLDDGALEPALPDVADGAMAAMMPQGMGDGERLEDPADGRAGRGAKQQVEMVRHQAVTIEPEGVSKLGPAEALKEGEVVLVVDEDEFAIVTAVDGVKDQAIVIRSEKSLHFCQVVGVEERMQGKTELAPGFRPSSYFRPRKKLN